MFNPVVVWAVLTSVLLVIAMWAMAIQEGEDMESEDFSSFAPKQQDKAGEYKHTA